MAADTVSAARSTEAYDVATNQAEQLLTIRLYGHPMDDGRTHIKGDDLPGFHFILEEGEDPHEEMFPILSQFLELYLRAKAHEHRSVHVRSVARALSMHDFSRCWGSVPAPRIVEGSYDLVAALG